MPDGLLEFGRDALTGRVRGPKAAMFRAAASVVEPFYSAVTTARNIGFDRGWLRSFDLGRPTISVGNITTGGTGKTPVVKWLADNLRQAGQRPAILMRGYASGPGGQSDEQLLLNRSLNPGGSKPNIPVMANPSRVAGAAAVLAADPSVDRFILDDGFQHRRARRNFDLVLINATDPFGGGRVLPRGLLREPLRGVRRADAVLITRASLVDRETIGRIKTRLASDAPQVPVYESDHAPTIDPKLLADRPVLAVSGIGDPQSFERQLTDAGVQLADRRRFGDHHRYVRQEIDSISKSAGGRLIVTTEKDWVKIEPLIEPPDRNGWVVVRVEIRFRDGDEGRLLRQIAGAGDAG